LADPVLPEPTRRGEDPQDCDCRTRADDGYLWTDDHWRLGGWAEPEGVPAYLLMPREHYDLPDPLPPLRQQDWTASRATWRTSWRSTPAPPTSDSRPSTPTPP